MKANETRARPNWSDPEDYRRQGRFPLDRIDLDAVRRECRESFERLTVLADQFPAD